MGKYTDLGEKRTKERRLQDTNIYVISKIKEKSRKNEVGKILEDWFQNLPHHSVIQS